MHLNIVGPFSPSQGSHCLTKVDRFTCWPEAVAILYIIAQTVAEVCYNYCIMRFSCLSQSTIDQGKKFESMLLQSLLHFLGINRIRSLPNYPQTNGMVREFHCLVKATLKAYSTVQWTVALPTILVGFQIAYKEDMEVTTQQPTWSMELVFGCLVIFSSSAVC